MLTPRGVAELGKVLGRLKAQGLAVVFITHKLHEAISMGDRVSVLRQGHVVGRIEPDELRAKTPEELQDRIVSLMFGSEATQAAEVAELAERVESHQQRRRLPEVTVFELDDVRVDPLPGEIGVGGVSLAVRAGEIMGVANSRNFREIDRGLANLIYVVSSVMAKVRHS